MTRQAPLAAYSSRSLPKRVRVSLGSAMVIGLLKGKLGASPTTAYLMTYSRRKCIANCGFCPQARESKSRADMLSRVSWPVFQTEKVLDGIKKAVERNKIRRVCIQALNYPEVFMHLLALVETIHQRINVPISISCQPLNSENIKLLAQAGAERIGIPLDAATEELFDKVKGQHAKGPYRWENQFKLLIEAVNIFGKGKVSTHLIVGLGENEKEMVNTIQKCVDIGVLPALFAFTPIAGTALENIAPPQIQKYRRIQVARHLILNGISRCENMGFDEENCIINFGVEKEALKRIIQTGAPFLTSGCPNCNRPYYNEKPSGPLYNYPKKISKEQLYEIEMQFRLGEV